MGDLNPYVGIDKNGLRNVLGAFGVGEKSKEGKQLTDFCVTNRLTIMNTFCQEILKWIW